VPLKVLAPELDCYYEDLADKSYILVRGEGIDLEMVAGKGTVNEDTKGGRVVEMDVFYEDGIAWVPLRKMAETLNYYVEYRDGYAVIDDRLSARKVVEDGKIFDELCAEFAPYIGTVTAGNTYHVAKDNPKASDANSGTEAYPFKTLKKAGQIARAGDTVIIHGGTYREILAPQNDGTAMAPITFRAAENEKVVISALEPISGFVNFKNNIYCAALDKDLGEGRNQLFYKGEALVEGRHPNNHSKVEAGETHGYPIPVPSIWPNQGRISIKVDNINETRREGYDIATSPEDLNQNPGHWKGGTFVALKGEAWTLVSGDIVDSGTGWLKLKEHEGSKSYNLGINGRYYRFVHKPDYGFITNHINTIDLPGEWYCGDGVMYVYPPEGANLSQDFEVKARQQVIDLRDRKYITLEGINTVGGGLTAYGDLTEGVVVDDCEFRWISHYTRLIDQSANYIDPAETGFMRDTTKSRGEVGFVIGGKNNAFINSKIEYSAGAGVTLMGLYNYVYNNNISNVSYAGGYPGAVNITRESHEEPLASYGGHVIRNNTMYNSGRALVNMGAFTSEELDDKYAPFVANELTYNRIYQGSITARDTGVTYQYGYTGGNDKRRTQIHHNYVSDMMVWDRSYDPYDANTNPGGIGTGNSHIYQDGYVCNQDTYYNLTFQTVAVGGMGATNGGTFEQLQPWTQVRQRNNNHAGIVPEGLDGIETIDYPAGKPFFAGSYDDGRERFMLNYENLQNGIKAYIPDTSDVVGSSWNFSDVKVASAETGYTLLSVDYMRDITKTEIIEVSASLTNEAGEVVSEVTMPISTAPSKDSEWLKASVIVPNDEAGTYDVNVTFHDEHAVALRLRTAEGDPAMRLAFEPQVTMYAGSYDEWIEGTSTGEILPATRFLNQDPVAMANNQYYGVGDTWMHTFIYKDRELKEECDTVEIMLGSGSPYHGQTVKIYADSMDGKPIAEFVVEDSLWKATTVTVPLAYTLSPGKHTFYADFDGVGKCCSVYYYDFYNSATRTTAEGEVAA